MDITVFSAAGCGKCVATKSHLTRRNIPFTEVKVDQYDGMVDTLRKATGTQLPVVMAFRSESDDVPDIIQDYHPDDIEALAHDRSVRSWPPDPR